MHHLPMCSAIEFLGQRYYFKHTPRLPILRRDGQVEWVQWGLPYSSDKSGVPQGACARRESLLAGKWTRLKPVPVKIPCSAFMERAADRSEVWFGVDGNLAIQGALIRLPKPVFTEAMGKTEAVVYVVTVQATGEVAEVHDRMPRLVQVSRGT